MAMCKNVSPLLLNHCRRQICTTNAQFNKRNPSKFPLFHFRWTRDFKERQKTNPDPDIKVYKYGLRDPGYTFQGKFHEVPEMIPEIIVPDLKDCELKPYVSYRAADVVQSEFTSQDLFDAVYSRKIEKDFKEGKLDEHGNALEASDAEKLTPDEAKKLARQTGADMFQ